MIDGLCRRCVMAGALGLNLSESDEPKLGTLGDYEIIERIGQGGMGTIYRAQQLRLNREVAIKLIPEGRLAGNADITRFRFEAMAAAELDHPNILPIYDVGEEDGQHYFSMPLLEGGSLESRIESFKSDPKTVATIMKKIADAMHYAHQRGILHRDLKPANILMRDDGEPLVCDFGLAKRLSGDSASLTQTGQMLGSPAYLAPEIVSGKASASVTSDLYALGIVLYQLLVGHVPFRAQSQLDVMRQSVENEAPKPRSLNSGVPRDLETICLKCLEKEPSHRYKSAAEFGEDLQRWLNGEPIQASPSGVPARVWKWTKRHPAIAALIGVTVTASFALIGILLVSTAKIRSERDIAFEQERKARVGQYLSDMVAAYNALDAGNLAKARELVEAQVPRPGSEDLRNTEWRLANQLCQSDEIRSIQAYDSAVSCFEVDEERGWLFTGSESEARVRIFNLSSGAPLMDLPKDLQINLPLMARRDLSNGLSSLGLGGDQKRNANPMKLGSVISLTLFNDRRYLGIGTSKDFLKIVDLEKPQIVGWWPELWTRPCTLPNSSMVIVGCGRNNTGSAGKTVIYDSNKVSQLEKVRQLDQGTGTVGVSADGSTIVTAGVKKGLQVYDSSFTKQEHIDFFPAIHQLSVAPDGSKMAAAVFHTSTVQFWNRKNGKSCECAGHLGEVKTVAYSPNGRYFASGSVDQSVRLWDGETGFPIRVFKGHAGTVFALKWTSDSRTLISASGDGCVKFWDAESRVHTPDWGSALLPMDLSPDGNLLLCVDEYRRKKELILLPTDGTSPAKTIKLDHYPVHAGFIDGGARFSAFLAKQIDGKLIPHSLPQWETQTLAPIQNGHPVPAKCLRQITFSPESSLVITEYADSKGLQLWDMTTGQRVCAFPAQPNDRFQDPRLSADASRLVVYSSSRNALIVYDTKTTTELRSIAVPSAQTFALSPDGKIAALCQKNNRITLWNIEGGQKTGKLSGHLFTPKRLSWSPDGNNLISATGDGQGSIRLWHIPSRREVGVLRNGGSWHWISFHPKGTALFAKKFRSDIEILHIPPIHTIADKKTAKE
jgi:WD40 repeat protein